MLFLLFVCVSQLGESGPGYAMSSTIWDVDGAWYYRILLVVQFVIFLVAFLKALQNAAGFKTGIAPVDEKLVASQLCLAGSFEALVVAIIWAIHRSTDDQCGPGPVNPTTGERDFRFAVSCFYLGWYFLLVTGLVFGPIATGLNFHAGAGPHAAAARAAGAPVAVPVGIATAVPAAAEPVKAEDVAPQV